MTIPFERTRALIRTAEFLRNLQDPEQTPQVPALVRSYAGSLLEHYPSYNDIEQAHKMLPDLFGPVPPYSRLSGTADVQGVIDATKAQPG